MKPNPLFVNSLFLAVAIGFASESCSDEPTKAAAPAADPMLGKEPGHVRDDNGVTMKLVWCPRGVVRMNNERVENVVVEATVRVKDATAVDDDEVDDGKVNQPGLQKLIVLKCDPAHAFLTRGYWLGKYEVTQAEWTRVAGTAPWKGQRMVKEGADFPATYISWTAATEFCAKLTQQERKAGRLPDDWEYTLPTEAQWERACRARSETAFSFGDDESKLPEYAWFWDNAWNGPEQFPRSVGQKKSNPWGFNDMHGNVWEWCRDWHGAKLPGGRDPEQAQNGSRRVIRGGSACNLAPLCRSAYRFGREPGSQTADLGFRVALSKVN